MNQDLSTWPVAKINAELDRLDVIDSKLCTEMIAAGRGHERPSDWMSKQDELAVALKSAYRRRMLARDEISRRYGPGAPGRLPEGFGPRKSSVR